MPVLCGLHGLPAAGVPNYDQLQACTVHHTQSLVALIGSARQPVGTLQQRLVQV